MSGSEDMGNFERIRQALLYIDDHLDERINIEQIAGVFHFSPYYFHRMFSVIVGKPIAAHIRRRRMEKAGRLLVETDDTLLEISLECGFDSYSAFSRTFRNAFGVSPREYRKLGNAPVSASADEMIAKLERRLKGGILVDPKLIERGSMLIAGVAGDGSRTAEIWKAFEELIKKTDLPNRLSCNGYEIRIYDKQKCECFVGLAVPDDNVDSSFTLFRLPASKYAAFDVYVARGYDSQNSAMDEWLETNKEGYSQKLYDGGEPYVVEYYDERFNYGEEDSIVEIWVPIEKAVDR